MEIKVIGSGSSGNAYRVSDGSTSLLLDAGLPIARLRAGCDFQLSGISGALISHSHGDHIRGASGLVRMGVDLYASPETLAEGHLVGHRCHAIDPLISVPIGTFYVKPFELHHDVRNYGYWLKSQTTGETLVYITDSYFTDYTFPGTNYWMVECNYSNEGMEQSIEKGYIPSELRNRLIQSHMSLEHLLELLRANDLTAAKAIYLLHLSDNNSNADLFKQEVQKVAACPVYVA